MKRDNKFGIITHYDVHNHGALLQLTALIRGLKQLSIDAKALKFDKNYDFMGHKLKTKYDVSIKSLSIYLKYLIRKGLYCTLYNFKKFKTLKKYKENSNIIGDYYSECKDLDGVIIGSDEVFALHTGPTPVFWGFCLPTDMVFSYAGSFGPTTYEDIKSLHALDFVKAGLYSMKKITVRDNNSAEIVEQLIGKRPPIVVDPVILYGYKEEIKSLVPPKLPSYLLIYAYDNRMNDEEEVNRIKDYAKKKGLKTVSAGFYHSWCDYNIDVDPINLLGYFKYANRVLTDTFHGSVMSLITGAQFLAKTRESNLFKLTNLLKEYGVDNRIIMDWDSIEKAFTQKIDYRLVNLKLEESRKKSLSELKEMVTIAK